MGMYIWTAFLPEPWLLVILIQVYFSQMSHRQRVLRELFDAWVESMLPHDFTVLCCLAKKGRMLFHVEHFTVEQNPA